MLLKRISENRSREVVYELYAKRRRQGFLAFLAGKPMVSPQFESSYEKIAWCDGWRYAELNK